jgi:stage IV sporulation protein FB
MVFKVCGIKVEITFLFVAFITFVISLKAPANLLITIASSLFHEMGHLLMMILVGNKPKKIKFEIVGMNIIRDNNFSISTKREIAISVGGPVMNFIVVIVSCIILCLYESHIILTCACINLILMTFNLLPIKSLDGGAILYFLLSQHFENALCRKILKITSALFIVVIYLWALYVFVITKYNFSLIIIAIFLTISLFQNNDY